jgi:hypothetical protein
MKKIQITTIIFILISLTSEIKWTTDSLLEKVEDTENYKYNLIDPENILSETERTTLIKELSNYSSKNNYIPYFFIVNEIEDNNKGKNVFLEEISERITRLLMDYLLSFENLLLCLITTKEKTINIRASSGIKTRIEKALDRIKLNSEKNLQNLKYKNAFSSILLDIDSFTDTDYDFIDKYYDDDDFENPFGPIDDDDEDEYVDPYVDDRRKEKENEQETKKDENDNDNDKIPIQRNDNDKKKETKNSFWSVIIWILVFLVFALAIIYYFMFRKFKKMNSRKLNYTSFMENLDSI